MKDWPTSRNPPYYRELCGRDRVVVGSTWGNDKGIDKGSGK